MIVKDVVVLKEAALDLENGQDFYEQREIGVGNYFWDSLIVDIESLFIFAGIHAKEHGVYRMLSKRFPYAIYYEIENETAFVIAILPMRRDPGWIEEEVKRR